ASLSSLADLQKAFTGAEKMVSVTIWRLEGSATKARELTLRVPVGRLGVVVAREPAPKALAAQRKSEGLLAARGGTNWPRLPGTRYEVSALKKLFEKDGPTVLFDSDASVAKLAELSAEGTLGKARFVHLATHGQARWDRPLASRMILARD